MCLAIPGRVIELWEDDAGRAAKVDFDGYTKDARLAFVDDIEVGDFTIVHMGFALHRIDEESARETITLLRELSAFSDDG